MSLLIKGVASFLGLSDTPKSYTGAAGYIAKVKSALDGLEFGNAVTQYQIPTNIVPDNIGFVQTLNTVGKGTTRMRIAGKYCILAEGVSGNGYVSVVNISNPASPVLCQRYAPSNDVVQALAVAGRYIYCVTTGNKRLWIIDWSNPNSLSTVGSIVITDTDIGTGLFVRGRYAYVTHSWTTRGIDIIDISNPASPVIVSSLNNATYFPAISDIIVIANTAYVVSKDYISTINIADPTNPVRISSLNVPQTVGSAPETIKIIGTTAYFTRRSDNKIAIVDVSNPASMVLLGTFSDATYLYNAFDFEVIGGWLFTTNYFGAAGYLTIFDVRNPAAVTRHESFALPLPGYGALALVGKYCFVAKCSTDTRFSIYQVWSLDLPTILGNVIWADQIYTNRLSSFEQIDAPVAQIGGVGIPDALPKLLIVPLVLRQVVATAPGTAYAELAALFRTNLDLSKVSVRQARVIVSGIGNEVGLGKGIQIYNSTDGATICEVTWDGNAQQNALSGTWTNCNVRKAVDIQVRVKGSSATENMTVDKVELQLSFF